MLGLFWVIVLIIGVYIFGLITNKMEESNNKNIAIYIVSFLVPLVGFIVGGINLTKDDEEVKKLGMNCIVLGILSLVVSGIVIAILF